MFDSEKDIFFEAPNTYHSDELGAHDPMNSFNNDDVHKNLVSPFSDVKQ